MDGAYTISDYLKGAVRGITPPDEALLSICVSAGVESADACFYELTERQKRLALAYLYVYIATGPSSSAKWSEKDGDWSQSGGGEVISAAQVRMYLRMADAIFAEYGVESVSVYKWGMRGGGFRNIRNYGRRRR